MITGVNKRSVVCCKTTIPLIKSKPSCNQIHRSHVPLRSGPYVPKKFGNNRGVNNYRVTGFVPYTDPVLGVALQKCVSVNDRSTSVPLKRRYLPHRGSTFIGPGTQRYPSSLRVLTTGLTQCDTSLVFHKRMTSFRICE